MVMTLKRKRPGTIKIEFADEAVTSLGGLVLAEKAGARLGLWTALESLLPARRGAYDWSTVVKSLAMGLLGGGQGTWAAQGLRQDEALLGLLSLEGAPEEATVWRALGGLGSLEPERSLDMVQTLVARRLLGRLSRPGLMVEGFVPVFADGTLLEGSAAREGTKRLGEKGRGLVWSAVFVGPALCAQRLAGEGEGEHTCVRELLARVRRRVLKPLGLCSRALVLADSLHGDDAALGALERQGLHYVVGANKLARTDATLAQLPGHAWQDTGARAGRGWDASGVCACWLQCEGWASKRLLVGRRWRRRGEMIWNHAGVLTDLREADVAPMLARGLTLAEAVWRLYDAKGAMETQFKDGLSDLGLHHPPCRQLVRNRGFYAVGALAWLLGVAVDVLGGAAEPRGSLARKDGGVRRRPVARRTRLWRLRRELWMLPGRVARHARELTVRLLGVGREARALFERYWAALARC